MTDSSERRPRVFISYSFDSDPHKDWVRSLAEDLTRQGVEVRLDQWHLHASQSLPEFMEREVATADCVIVVCTPAYAAKADGRTGGAGYEHQIISGAILAGTPRQKFIPLLRAGVIERGPNCGIPISHSGTKFIDFRRDAMWAEAQDELLRVIFNKPRYVPPALGQVPALRPEDPTSIATQSDTPLPNPAKRLLYRFVNQHNVMLDTSGRCYRTVQYCVENNTDNELKSVMMGETFDRPTSDEEFRLAVTDEKGRRLQTEFAIDTPSYKRWDAKFHTPIAIGERLLYFSQYISCDIGRYHGQHTQRVREGLIHYVLLRDAAQHDIIVEVRDEGGWRDVSDHVPVYEGGAHRVVTLPYRNIEAVFQFRISWDGTRAHKQNNPES
jgi:hypothetical protein